MIHSFNDKFASVRDSELKEAVTLENENDLDKSMIIYKKILENDKYMFKAEMDYAKLLVDIGLTNDATSLYLDIPNMYQNQAKIWNKINEISGKQGRLDLVVYTTFGLTKFDDSDIKNNLDAQVAYFSSIPNFSGLLLVSNGILSIDSTNIHALIGKAGSLTNFKEYDAALSVLNTILSIDPTNITVINFKASVYSQMNNYDEAISTYEQALTIDPNDESTLANEATAMLNKGHVSNSLDTINKILTTDPKNISALSFKSMLLALLNRFDESSLIDDQILSLDSNQAQNVLSLKADLLIKSGQYEATLPILNKLLILQPTNYNMLFDKAFVLDKLTRYDESLSTIDQMLSYNPTDVETLNAKDCSVNTNG